MEEQCVHEVKHRLDRYQVIYLQCNPRYTHPTVHLSWNLSPACPFVTTLHDLRYLLLESTKGGHGSRLVEIDDYYRREEAMDSPGHALPNTDVLSRWRPFSSCAIEERLPFLTIKIMILLLFSPGDTRYLFLVHQSESYRSSALVCIPRLRASALQIEEASLTSIQYTFHFS